MPIISVEIMKTIDEREMQKKKKKERKTNKGSKGAGDTKAIVKG